MLQTNTWWRVTCLHRNCLDLKWSITCTKIVDIHLAVSLFSETKSSDIFVRMPKVWRKKSCSFVRNYHCKFLDDSPFKRFLARFKITTPILQRNLKQTKIVKNIFISGSRFLTERKFVDKQISNESALGINWFQHVCMFTFLCNWSRHDLAEVR